MIELKHDRLVFSFPEVHRQAWMSVDFQRTLRIPDNEETHALPPGLGFFPLRHVDDFAGRLPDQWIDHGGVMLPMYQAEAMWLNFGSPGYPFLVKIAAGKINAVTGEEWSDRPNRDPQDYLVVPVQPWLDGFCVDEGIIRQFVAMPLGAGYTAEEQLTGKADHGGLQIVVIPMKKEVYEKKFARKRRGFIVDESIIDDTYDCYTEPLPSEMGLAPGGRMHQEIYDDPHDFSDWDLRHSSRCFVHLANSMIWRAITGEAPPTVPPTAREYSEAGLPWFEYYGEGHGAVPGADRLESLKTVREMGEKKGDVPLPENDPVKERKVVRLRAGMQKHHVR